MKTIKNFSPEYKNINKYVDSVVIPHLLRESDQNIDLFVNLRDGTSYSFTVSTPDDIKEMMQRDGLYHFISPGLIIVKAINLESILSAIEECLKYVDNKSFPLDHFGVLQR